MSIAIVGLGPWGICALERVVTTARAGLPDGARIEVHVVEPGVPGAGVYDPTQPDYLLLNNPCGQLSLYPFADADPPRYGVGLFDWAVGRGYRWVGDRCLVGAGGEPIQPHHFLPRRLMGEYLNWFYGALREAAPSGLEIVHHQTTAVDLIARHDGRETVCMGDGQALVADHVIVTSGHTSNRRRRARGGMVDVNPYPVSAYVDRLGPRSRVAVSGMGLVATDVVTALTVGRGGQFVERNGSLRYRPSGREPQLQMFSRSGLPFTAKSVTGADRTDVYRAVVCTPTALRRLRERRGRRRLVDVRTELLPMLFGEMHARYYAQVAFQSGSVTDARAVRERLGRAWTEGQFDAELAALASRFGRFDPETLFFGRQPQYGSTDDYQRFVYRTLSNDLYEAEVPDGASPIKSATEVLRIFRDPVRSIVEQGGVALDSYPDFHTEIRSRIHRLVAGPPALRSRQMLALIDAGILSTPFGPMPALGPGSAASAPMNGVNANGNTVRRRMRISSTSFEHAYLGEVDALVRGHLDEPRLHDSASELLSRLYRRGRMCQFRYGAVPVGSIDLTADSHPIALDGRPQDRLWVFGVLTEGIRHFTHYIPSPRSRIRAFDEIGGCVSEILGEAVAADEGAGVAALLEEQVA